MATETWDQIEAGWQAEKTERRTMWMRLLRIAPAMVLFGIVMWSLAKSYERQQIARESWKNDNARLQAEYGSFISAVAQDDTVAYQLLAPLAFNRTFSLQKDLTSFAPRAEEFSAKNAYLTKVRGCLAPSLKAFQAISAEKQASCQRLMQSGN